MFLFPAPLLLRTPLRSSCERRRPGVYCLWLLLVPLHTPVLAETYSELRDRLAEHPSVRTEQASAAQWTSSAEGAMGLPNPSFTLGLNNLPLSDPTRFDRYLPSSRSLEVMQRIPNLSGREAERSTHLAHAGVAQLKQQQALAGLERRLITALAERQRVAQSKAALQLQLEKLAELGRWLGGEMEGGSAVYGRFDELDVQRGRIEEQRLALEGEDLRWQAELRELVDQVPDTPAPQTTPRLWDGEPDGLLAVRVASRKLDAARAQVKERRAAFSPDYAIGAAYQQRESGANFDGDDWFTLKATISLPLWADSNQRPKLSAAEHGVTLAVAERDQRLREARGEYENALADYRTASALLLALEERAGKLRNLEGANRRRYESGEGSLEKVIQPAMQRVEIEMDEATQRARRTIAAARANALLAGEIQ